MLCTGLSLSTRRATRTFPLLVSHNKSSVYLQKISNMIYLAFKFSHNNGFNDKNELTIALSSNVPIGTPKN